MDLIGSISATTKAIEFAKTIKDIDCAFEQAELKAKAADLLSNLADIKIALVEAREEIKEKENEIGRLKRNFSIKVTTIRRNDMSYERNSSGEPEGYPFCPRCETIDGVMIKIVKLIESAQCPECKSTFGEAVRFIPQQ